MSERALQRCDWSHGHPLLADYHDNEWGVPCHHGQTLFEFLLLEGAQAGLSWLTILQKRKNYAVAYQGYDPEVLAGYGASDVERLMANPGIIRNRLKIESAITNARCLLSLQEERIGFQDFVWQFVDGKPVQNAWHPGEVPSSSPQSKNLSRALKQRGFKFVGPTICYAFMQATGMVNDHLTTCFRHPECANL